MTQNLPTDDFTCPQCHARYKVVRMELDPQHRDKPVHCIGCRQPMAATEGDKALKYFRVR